MFGRWSWHGSWEMNHGAFGLVMEIDGLDTRDAFGAFVVVILWGEGMDLVERSVPLEVLFVIRDCRCEPCYQVKEGLEDGGGGRSNLDYWNGRLSAIDSHGAVAKADVVFKDVEVGEREREREREKEREREGGGGASLVDEVGRVCF